MHKVDMHVHTYFSYKDGISSPGEMIRAAEGKGLSGIAITDHDNMDAFDEVFSIETDLFIIPGCEISSKEGHILAYGLEEPVQRGLSARETIDLIHSQNALAVAAHPFDSGRNALGNLIFELPFDAIEALNGHSIFHRGKTAKICAKNGFSMVAGTDAHMSKEVGSCYTLFKDVKRYKKEIIAKLNGIGGSPVNIMAILEKHVRTKILHQGLF